MDLGGVAYILPFIIKRWQRYRTRIALFKLRLAKVVHANVSLDEPMRA